MSSQRANEPVLSVMRVQKLAQDIGGLLRLARVASPWTVEEPAQAAAVTIKAVGHGRSWLLRLEGVPCCRTGLWLRVRLLERNEATCEES